MYDVNRSTGAVEWQVGGNHSSFTLIADAGQHLDQVGQIFANQHDPTYIGHDTLTVFDNEGPVYPESRAVTIRLDFAVHTATLEQSDDQPGGLIARTEGSVQTLSNGDRFVDWGSLGRVSEFSAGGKLLFNAKLAGQSYRAYLLPWGS